jgi:hypothetical protein
MRVGGMGSKIFEGPGWYYMGECIGTPEEGVLYHGVLIHPPI